MTLLGVAGLGLALVLGVLEFDVMAIIGLGGLVAVCVFLALVITLRTAGPWWVMCVLSFLTLPLGEVRWTLGPLWVPPAILVWGVGLVVVGIHLVTERRELVGDRGIALALLAVLTGFAVSMSRASNLELAGWSLGKWIFHVMLFGLLSRPQEAAWLRRIVLTLAAVTALLSVWGLAVYLSGHSSEVNFYAGVGTRTATGLHIAVVFPFAVAAALSRDTGWIWRTALWTSIVASAMAVGFSYSRAAWIAILAGLLVVLGLSRRRLGILVVLLVGMLLLGILGPEDVTERFWTTFSMVESSDLSVTNALRIRLQRLALQRIGENPVVGVGLGNYTVGLPWYLYNPTSPISNVPNNFYLTVWAEGGLLAFIGFLAFIVLVLRKIWRAGYPWINDERADLLRGALGSVVAIAVFFLFSDDFNNTVVWSVLGLAVGGARMSRRAAVDGDSYPTGARTQTGTGVRVHVPTSHWGLRGLLSS